MSTKAGPFRPRQASPALPFRGTKGTTAPPHKGGSWQAAAVISLAAFTLGAASCNLAPDWSAWQGTNLIPATGFDSTSWVPDEGASETTDAVTGLTTLTPRTADDIDGTYMALTRVTDVTNNTYGLSFNTISASPRYTAGDAGFANTTADTSDSGSIYYGMSADAVADGYPEIYRLEVKNLFDGGDFESGIPGTLSSTASISQVIDPAGATGTRNMVASYALTSTQQLAVDFSGVTDANSAYNLTFWFRNSAQTVPGTWGTGNLTMAYPEDNTAADTWVRFPWGNVNTNTIVNSVSGNSSVWTINTGEGTPFTGYLDDIQFTKVDQAVCLRMRVPWKLLDSGGTALRPELKGGGTYTLKFEVRSDPTVMDASTRRTNSFPADYLSVMLRDYDSGNSMADNPSGVSRLFHATGHEDPVGGAISETLDWESGWATVSVSVSSLLKNVNFDTLEDAQELLEICITPTCLVGDTYRTPGSLLIAAPRLYWSPD